MKHRKPVFVLATALVATALLAAALPRALADEDEASTASRLEGALEGVQITLDAAAKAAVAKVGGTAVAAHFEMDDGKPVFEVIVLARVKLGEQEIPTFVEVEVDAKSGAVVETEILGDDPEDDDDDDDDDEDEDDDE